MSKNTKPRRGGCLRYAVIAGVALFGCIIVVMIGSALTPATKAPPLTSTPHVVPTYTPTPVIVATVAPTLPAPSAEPDTRSAAAINPFSCAGGCATPPDASCTIKGNVNSDGDKIYHTFGSGSYERTDIKPEEGDAWFCTEAEAVAAGFRGAGD